MPVKYVPQSVSIVNSDDFEAAMASNQLPVLNHVEGTGTSPVNSTDIGVCVKPMHFHYNKTLELIEFIELNKILGVTKFTLYNDTVSPEVKIYMTKFSIYVPGHKSYRQASLFLMPGTIKCL